MGLSKYIVSLPGTTFSIASMVFLSFVLGCIVSALEPSADYSLLYSIIYGGAAGFLIFGVDIYNERCSYTTHDKCTRRKAYEDETIHVSFPIVSMLIVGFVYLIGSLISSFSIYSYTIDALVYGCVIIFAIRILVLWGTSNIKFF